MILWSWICKLVTMSANTEHDNDQHTNNSGIQETRQQYLMSLLTALKATQKSEGSEGINRLLSDITGDLNANNDSSSDSGGRAPSNRGDSQQPRHLQHHEGMAKATSSSKRRKDDNDERNCSRVSYPSTSNALARPLFKVEQADCPPSPVAAVIPTSTSTFLSQHIAQLSSDIVREYSASPSSSRSSSSSSSSSTSSSPSLQQQSSSSCSSRTSSSRPHLHPSGSRGTSDIRAKVLGSRRGIHSPGARASPDGANSVKSWLARGQVATTPEPQR